MKYLSLGLLVTGAIVLGNQSQGQAATLTNNLFKNSSFEISELDPNKSHLSLGAGSTAIKDWEVSRGEIDYVGRAWNAANGHHSLDLVGTPLDGTPNSERERFFGGIKQTVTTIAGARYRLRFSLAANPGITGMTTLGVSIGNESKDFYSDPQAMSGDPLSWDSSPQWEFNALDNKTTIEFFTKESSSAYGGPALDAVSLVQIAPPTPSPSVPESTPIIGVFVFGALALSLRREKNF